MAEKPGGERTFLNETIMTEVLGELKEIAARGGISCSCGMKDYKVKVLYSAVELACAHCGPSSGFPQPPGRIWRSFAAAIPLPLAERRRADGRFF